MIVELCVVLLCCVGFVVVVSGRVCVVVFVLFVFACVLLCCVVVFGVSVVGCVLCHCLCCCVDEFVSGSRESCCCVGFV